MSHCSSNTSIDESIFIAFLAGDQHARNQFPQEAQNFISKTARSLAPDLACCDLLEEVEQQTWLLLLTKSAGSFNPKRGSAEKYLRLIIRTAAQDIRAMYAPPGQRTRLYRDDDGHIVSQEFPLSLDESIAGGEEDVFSLYDIIPGLQDETLQFENHDYTNWAIDIAWDTSPDFIGPALEYIYYGGSSCSDVAKIFGVHTSTITRRISSWRAETLLPLETTC